MTAIDEDDDDDDDNGGGAGGELIPRGKSIALSDMDQHEASMLQGRRSKRWRR